MSTSTARRAVIAPIAVALLAAGAGLGAPAQPASALASDCAGYPRTATAANGFRFVPAATRANASFVRTTREMPGLVLYSGRIDGVQYGWASYDIARNRDRVWMDVSRNGGRSWLQCGPFEPGVSERPAGADNTSTQLATPGMRTSKDANVRFRACGQTYYAPADSYSPVHCTGWW